MLDALGYEGWKAVKDYGKRWLVEITFSAFKRVLGETLRARRFLSQKAEASLKACYTTGSSRSGRDHRGRKT